MADGPSQILGNLDFATLKNTFKSYLRGQDAFKDYDFEGSNFSILLDLLSYNTYLNSFYLNMIGNEMFLDSAQLRDSAISHAKELNYVPRSFTSSKAVVDLEIKTNSPNKRNISIPKGTSFTARTIDGSYGKSYTFTTDKNIVLTNKIEQTSNTAIFVGTDIELYEGSYIRESYSWMNGQTERILLNNQSVDLSSLRMTVLEDSAATALSYTRANSLFDLNEESQVFFVQGAENFKYELVFGDGIIGKKPKNNSLILLEYRVCNGELPNGLSVFLPDGTIDGETDIRIRTTSKSSGGSIAEDLESIKFNAPRAFTTQERAVTTSDFETLLKQKYPEINAVSAYGGEQLDPPQYGKVFVAVDLKETDILPKSKKDEYYTFLKPRSIVSIDPVFVDPEYVYVAVTTNIKYNINTTPINADDIRTLVLTGINQFNIENLNGFNKTLRYSKLVKAIDGVSPGIVSNETELIGLKYFYPALNTTQNYNLIFGYPLKQYSSSISDTREQLEDNILTSSVFTYNNQLAYLKDDGAGTVHIIAHTQRYTDTTSLGIAGTIDYASGILSLNNFTLSSYEGSALKVYAKPESRDIQSTKDIILNILDEDISITVDAIRD